MASEARGRGEEEDGGGILETRCVGHYQVGEPLGEGGFGQVFSGWDSRLERSVALKFLRRAGTRSDLVRDRSLREARLAAWARHPALVAVYDLVSTPEEAVIVMERVSGRTLKQRMREGAITLSETLSILRQAAEALSALHAQGMAHGDLKPSNLMIEHDGRLRVLDFGLAAHIDSAAAADAPDGGHRDTVLGTPAYMSPERLQGAPSSSASDIYALGVVGQALLRAEDEATLPMASASDDDIEQAIRRELSALLERMTERAPSRRTASMAVVAREIERIGRGLEASPVSVAAGGESRAVHRLRALTVAVVVVLLGAGSAAGILALVTADSTAEAPVLTALSPREAVRQAEALLREFDREGAIVAAIEHLERVGGAERLRAPVSALLAIAYCLRYANDDRDPLWLSRAANNAELAVRADDQFALGIAAQAWVEEYRGFPEAAEEAYLTALALEPDNRHALLGHARLLTAAKRFEEAESVLADALGRHPEDRLFWDALGTLRFRQADYLAAEEAFRQSIELKPDSVYAYANLNAVLLRQDRMDEALAVLQAGLNIRPHGQLYNNLGTVLYARGRFAEAAAAFEAALSDARGSPNDYLKWANLADALRWAPGREAEAHAAYARALQLLRPLLRPERPDATRYSRAALYAARLGERDQAAEYLERAGSVAHESADFWFRAMLTAESLGERERSLDNLAAALKLGYPRHLVETEPELVSLRRDRRYHRILNGSEP